MSKMWEQWRGEKGAHCKSFGAPTTCGAPGLHPHRSCARIRDMTMIKELSHHPTCHARAPKIPVSIGTPHDTPPGPCRHRCTPWVPWAEGTGP